MHHNPAIDAILTRMTSPTCVEEVLTLPSFYNLLGEFEKTSGMSVDAMSREDQDRIVQRRLRQLVDICRINPIWHKRIDDALGAEPADSFDAFQHIPLTDKDTFAAMFTGGRPGMVVPIDRCGFEIVASGGTSSGQPNETVYPLDELQETYAWAGRFMGRHMMARHLPGKGAKWVATTLADYQMWSSGTMVGGVLQKIPGVNYIGAGPMSKDVFQLMMSYPGPKAVMGITRSIELLPAFSIGLSRQAREDLRIALYGSGLVSPKVRAELKAAYPNIAVLSYFAATQAETIGLQLSAESEVLTTVPCLHLVEAVDDNGRWVDVGQEGELVVTRLFGNAAPVLRYKVGDRIRRSADCLTPTLNATQFEYIGRSGDFFHIGDTQYSARKAISGIIAELRNRWLIDLDQVANDLQLQLDRSAGTFLLVAVVPGVASHTRFLHSKLGGAADLEGAIIAGLTSSLSVFNGLEANERYIRKSGYRFDLLLIEPDDPVLVRTVFGKVPIVMDKH